MTTTTLDRTRSAAPRLAPAARPGFGAALRWEARKLRAQVRTKALLLGALLAPAAVVLVVHGQTRPPKDTLFGRFATENGFAMALLIMGVASQWVLPLLTAVVAGDIFASEDQHGTWKTVLTRSTSRARLFWAKAVAATVFGILALVLLAASTIASSLLIVGHQPLTGLSGQTIASRTALQLVAASWATMALPVVGFTCLAMLFSVWSRNAAVGIAAPVVLGLVMQLAGALGGIESLRPYLLTTPFEAWHGLLASPRFTGPILHSAVTSAGWSLVCLVAAYLIMRRRDITGG
jgi:ABC-2 type transport system permease protein